MARRAGAHRPDRDDVHRARRLQLQHARAAARLGHAARRRPRIRPPLRRLRAGSACRCDRDRVAEAGDVRAFALGTFGFSTLLLVLAPVHDVRLAGLLLVGIGASFTLLVANGNSLVQLAAPDHLRGRSSGSSSCVLGLAPFGSLLAGILVEIGGTGSRSWSAARRHRGGDVRRRRQPRRPPSTRRGSALTDAADTEGARRCDKEEMDDDLREPRLELRQHPMAEATERTVEPRTARRHRREASAPSTPAASSFGSRRRAIFVGRRKAARTPFGSPARWCSTSSRPPRTASGPRSTSASSGPARSSRSTCSARNSPFEGGRLPPRGRYPD